MKPQPKTRWRGAAALALLALLFLGVQMLGGLGLRGARLDLSAERLFTLSAGTRQILAALPQPLRVRFYFSSASASGYAQVKAYARRVEDLLHEYQARSHGKITLEVIDPEPYSSAEDEAVAYGLNAARADNGSSVYFGLVVTDAADGRSTIPFFVQEREANLEYDLTKLVFEMTRPHLPKLAIATSLPLQFGPGGIMAAAQGRAEPYAIYDQLSQLFEIEMLGQHFDRIGDDVDVLLLAHAAELTDQELYAIDQYVLRGGKLIAFIDPLSETAAALAGQQGFGQGLGMGEPQIPTRSDLGPLLAAWGVDYDGSEVVGDRRLAQRVSMGGAALDYVPWLGLGADQMARRDVVVGELSSINLAAAGALRIKDGVAGVTPLLSSSDEAGLIPASALSGRPDPADLARRLKASATYLLGVRIERPVATAFPAGPPAKAEANDETAEAAQAAEPALPLPAHLAKSAGSIHAIVVADADLLEDRFWVQMRDYFGNRVALPIADNGRFVINAADNLSGSDALISLRSRGVSSRPFRLIDDIRRDAEARYLIEQEKLQNQLSLTEQRLAELEGGDPAAPALITPEQQAEIERFRGEVLETRRALRAVERNLRRDIDRLEQWVTLANVALVPGLLLVIAGIVGWRRRRVA